MWAFIDLVRTARLLADDSHSSIISWCPSGNAFVVKDLDKFTRSILPRTFLHSNFAFFVRQLNEHEFTRVSADRAVTDVGV